MSFEEQLASLNQFYFFREFTFAKTAGFEEIRAALRAAPLLVVPQ
jgi:hypothetical protein